MAYEGLRTTGLYPILPIENIMCHWTILALTCITWRVEFRKDLFALFSVHTSHRQWQIASTILLLEGKRTREV